MNAQDAHLQMWAGLECTLNRVKDRWINQEDKNGHSRRLAFDFKMFSSLGVKKTRYPCLWELVAPDKPGKFNWENLDYRLQELKRLNIDVIATFLHHGSGPKYTSLIDEKFPQKLEEYAEAFAARYPWIEDYTPINEINTTTRFSLLYGHWYPHHKMDHQGYIRSLFLQCKGTILAMRAIRKYNPKARLVQTDDLGRCQSTEPLKQQAEFENHRRWLSWDMLCGMLDEKHPLYSYLKSSGLKDEEMHWLKDNACPPDVIGVNHYLLSNRFLDHRTGLHPREFDMDNGQLPVYSDIGAIDTSEAKEIPTPASLMRETWQRYRLPIAITEVHVMGDRSSQMKWLYEVWNAAKEVREEGVNLVAITVWSLLGTYDWHKLCTICELFYEPGVFDLRSPDNKPRHTGLSRLVQDLASKGESVHPILQADGWWKTNRRLRFIHTHGNTTALDSNVHTQPLLITGGTGTLGQVFARSCGAINVPYRLVSRSHMDITDLEQVRKMLKDLKPWAVINTAGYLKVDQAEDEIERCFKENVTGPLNLAMVCAEMNIPLINFSSDMVFDGENPNPYTERDIVSPLNVFGLSKVEAEKTVLSINPNSLIIRTSNFFGPWDDKNFVIQTLCTLIQNREVVAAHDTRMTPTYLPDLASASLDLLLDGVKGIVHLTNKGDVSWSEFATISAEMAKCKFSLDPAHIVSKTWQELNFKAKRPRNSALVSEKYAVLPSLENALDRYFNQLEAPLISGSR